MPNRNERRHGFKNHGNLQPQLKPSKAHRTVTTKTGHNDTHVLVDFNGPISNLVMTVEGVDRMIEELQGAKAALLAHIARGEPLTAKH